MKEDKLSKYLSLELNNIFAVNSLPKKIAVALSGGNDSMALTFLLKEFCLKNNVKLIALTVDHNLRENSAQEAKDVNNIIEKNHIEHHILKIAKSHIATSNIESNLRKLRYELLYDFCLKNQINFLFIGHHDSDNAENFLIRLFRGSSLDGLSKMKKISKFRKISLVRPLIDSSKRDLEIFLKNNNIEWFEDETNQEKYFLRNKIRNFLSTLDDKEAIPRRITSLTEEISELREFFDQLLIEQSKEIVKFFDGGYFSINLAKFSKINPKISLKILSLILLETSGAIYKPRKKKLINLFDKIAATNSTKNFKTTTLYGCVIEKFNEEELVIYREKKQIKSSNYVKFDDNKSLLDGRLIIKNSDLNNLIFPTIQMLKNISKSGIDKKISATKPWKKSTSGEINPAEFKFFFRTILEQIF